MARDGDDEAFAVHYERFSPRVFDFLARLLGERSAAEEIAQDAFVTAYVHRSGLRHPKAVRSWLFSIAYRRAMDHLHRTGRERSSLPEATQVASADGDSAARLVHGEAAELAWAAAQTLDARQYSVVDLSLRQNLVGTELARVLAVIPTHAAVLGHRARVALAKAVVAVLAARSPGRFPHARRDMRVAMAAALALLVIAGLGLGLSLGAGPHVAGRSARIASGKLTNGSGGYVTLSPLTWRVVPSPDPAGPAAYTELLGLTCASLDACWAVGDYSQTANQPVVLRRDGGTWQPVPLTGAAGTQVDLLEGITCVDPTDCWAVGDRKPLPRSGTSVPNSTSSTGYYVRSAILHFDGHSWNLVASPSVSGTSTVNDLAQVSCASATDCWAVGTWTKLGSTGLHPLLLHFDGTGWRLSAVPNLGPPRRFYTTLASVVCTSPTDCWMTGDYTAPDGRVLALAARLGSNGWRVFSLPNLGSQVRWAGPIVAHTTANMPPNDFRGIACPGPKNCWGADEFLDPAGLMRFQLVHFDGQSWKKVSLPNPAGSAGEIKFGQIACPALNDCWAVGDVLPGDTIAALSLEKAFALHFDGHNWSLVALPDPGVPYVGAAGFALPSDEAYALQCPTVRLCVIAGRFADGQGITGTGSLILEGRSP